MVNIKGSTVVVLADSGTRQGHRGRVAARGAAKVYATARAPKPSEDTRVVSVELDVTKPESIQRSP